MAALRKPTLSTTGTFNLFNKNTTLTENIFKLVTEGTILPIESLISIDTYKKYRYLQKDNILTLLKEGELNIIYSDKPSLKVSIAIPAFVAVKNGQVKVFINVSNHAKRLTETSYHIEERVLFSLLTAGYNEYIWHHNHDMVIRKGMTLFQSSALVYSEAMYKVFNRLYSVGTNPQDVEKIKYFSAKFALNYMLGLPEETAREIATKVVGSSTPFVDVIDSMKFDFSNSAATDGLNAMFSCIGMTIRSIKISESALVETWLKMYGQSAAFGLDYYPAFVTMLANASIGAYTNNQKSIESLLKMGGETLLNQYYSCFA